jgi:hypothetical protein
MLQQNAVDFYGSNLVEFYRIEINLVSQSMQETSMDLFPKSTAHNNKRWNEFKKKLGLLKIYENLL